MADRQKESSLSKTSLEWKLRCRHKSYYNLYWQRDQGLNPGPEKPKGRESARGSQRGDHLSWALKPEKERVFKQNKHETPV